MPEPTVARLTSPAQLVAALPLWLGYTPTESLVVACCHEPRGQVGLTMRFDLPAPADEEAVLDEVVRRVRHQRASRLVVAVFTEADDGDDGLVHASLVERLRRALPELVLTEAVLVRAGRFWSYVCEVPSCCPADGRPVTAASGDEQVRLLEAEQVLRGQVVLRDRAELEALLAGPQVEAAEQAATRCDRACLALAAVARSGTRATWRPAVLARWEAALAQAAVPPVVLSDDLVAELAVSLADRQLRDLLAAHDDVPALVAVLEEVARRTPAPYDVPVCTLLAWVLYCEGGGAAVTILLERALAGDPEYALAELLADVVLGQVPPETVRRLTQDAAREVRSTLPGLSQDAPRRAG